MSAGNALQDLRVKMGVILALALLPILVFSLWQSYYNYKRDANMQTAILRDIAQDAVMEIVDAVSTTKAIMRVSVETMDSKNCGRDITRILDNFPYIYNVVLSGPRGEVYCEGRAARSISTRQPAESRVTPDRPFYIDVLDSVETETGARGLLVISYGHFESKTLKRLIFAGFAISDLRRLQDRSALPDNLEVTVLSPSGNVLLGPIDHPKDKIKDWIEIAEKNGEYSADYKDRNSKNRELTVLKADGAELFIAISASNASIFSWNRVNPFSSSIVPVMAWLFGFVAIWISTDKLILLHLRKMRKAMLGFARGETSYRVGDMKEAPATLNDLGQAFDLAADKVVERENELRDSLDQKETLLREIHHRVKNNLQIINSLLNMQERKLSNPEALNVIKETRNRIDAIALAHKALYEGDDLRMIPMESFLEQLVSQLQKALLADQKKMKVSLSVECTALGSDRATPVALFIVEAFTNAVKHGAKSGGDINITVTENSENVTVVVENTKIGIKPDPSQSGMGSKLMSGFARQLSGTFTAEPTHQGYTACLTFPKHITISPASHI